MGGYVAVAPAVDASLGPRLLLAAAVAFAFTAAGNALNDFTDLEIDRVNHPIRPLPSGRLTPRTALLLSAALFILSIPAAASLGAEPLAVAGLNLVAMVAYEARYKKQGVRGNLLISYLVASLFLFGGLAVFRSGTVVSATGALQRVLILFVLAFLATLGREIVKDIEDMAGDVDRHTLAKVLGAPRASFMAAAAFLGGVALSGLPSILGILRVQYLAVVAVADAIFIYCALNSRRRPREIGLASKYAMLVALVAFLVGGL